MNKKEEEEAQFEKENAMTVDIKEAHFNVNVLIPFIVFTCLLVLTGFKSTAFSNFKRPLIASLCDLSMVSNYSSSALDEGVNS